MKFLRIIFRRYFILKLQKKIVYNCKIKLNEINKVVQRYTLGK